MRCKCGGRKCASAICSTIITTTRFPCFPSLPLPRFACALAPGVSPALLLPGRLSPLPCFEPSLGSSLRSSRSLPSRPRSRFLPSLYRSRSSLGAPPSRSLPPSVLPSPSTLASLAPSSSVLPPLPPPLLPSLSLVLLVFSLRPALSLRFPWLALVTAPCMGEKRQGGKRQGRTCEEGSWPKRARDQEDAAVRAEARASAEGVEQRVEQGREEGEGCRARDAGSAARAAAARAAAASSGSMHPHVGSCAQDRGKGWAGF